MKNNLNRIYSFLLATLMIVGMLSASAFSEENTVSDEDTLDLKGMKQAYSIISNELDISAVTLTPQEEDEEEKDDSEQPDLEVTIFFANTESIELGDTLLMEAFVYGPDAEKELTYQWETSVDGETWTKIENATESTYSFLLDEENSDDFFRVIVDLKPVNEELLSSELNENEAPAGEQIEDGAETDPEAPEE